MNLHGGVMAVGMHPAPQYRRLPPALVTDLPVLVVLVGCWLLVPLPWAHLTTGLGLLALVLVYLATRRRLPARLLRRPRSGRRLAAMASAWAVLVAMAAVTVTGSLRWAGVPREEAWHGGAGYLLLTTVMWHLWSVRRRLRARTRSTNQTDAARPSAARLP